MPTPGSRVPGERPGDASLRPGLVSVDENLLSFRTQPYSPAFGLDGGMFGAELACAQEGHDGLVDEEGAELFHEVEGQAGPFVGWRVSDSEGRIQPGGVECADAFAEEDGVPVGQCRIGQVAGWAAAASIEGDVGGNARTESVEVGGRAGSFDTHDVVDGARVSEAASPAVHVRGRVSEVEAGVAPGDAGEDVDLSADLCADEGGGQVKAARFVAREVDLGEQAGRVGTPPGTDEAALVGAAA